MNKEYRFKMASTTVFCLSLVLLSKQSRFVNGNVFIDLLKEVLSRQHFAALCW